MAQVDGLDSMIGSLGSEEAWQNAVTEPTEPARHLQMNLGKKLDNGDLRIRPARCRGGSMNVQVPRCISHLSSRFLPHWALPVLARDGRAYS